ncbi:MAG: flippase-like domain-containing protein [Acidimicrobiia bacterium]
MTSRYFSGDEHQPRVRRSGDAVRLVLGILIVVWTALIADTVVAAEQALVDLAGSGPLWFDHVYSLVYFGGLLFVVVLIGLALSQGSKQLDLIRDVALAVALTLVAGILLVWLIDGPFPAVFPEWVESEVDAAFPIFRVAVLSATVVVASPHLTRPIRRLGWIMIVIVAISGFGLGFGFPSDAFGGFGLGLAAGAGVLVVFGSPAGYPDPKAVIAALADFGLNVSSVKPAVDQSWGVRRLVGTMDDGSRIEIKAYGRDATDSQLISKFWRSVWYREGGQTFSYSRVQAVEHEALVMLVAQHEAVATPSVLAVGIGGDDLALLATAHSQPIVDPSVVSAETLALMWKEVAKLHDAGIAHGSLTVDAFGMSDQGPLLGEMSAATLSGSDTRMGLDIVSFLYSTSIAVGSQKAVDAARDGIGDEQLVAALPFLQPPALTRSQRKLSPKPKAVVGELRDAIVDVTGAEVPEPGKLRRVEWKNLIMPALSLIAAYALIGMLTDIDFVAVWEVVQDAAWGWIVLGFVIGQFVFVPEATGMLYATGYDLPLKPLTVLQVSVKWIGLAVPSAAGRVTMNTLFLRKFGVSPTIAVTQGALDGLAGFFVEVGILLLALIASDVSLDLDTSDINWPVLLLIVVVLIAISVVIVFRVKRIHDVVIPAIRDAWHLLWGILKDPKRTLGLLGSNLASRAILAMTLWLILIAIGTPLPYVTALVATVATNLLAGLVPIPGGIGVAEAALTSFLMFFGIPAEAAFAAAVVFRLATFYIPAGEGFFAMRWLEANGHL